MDDETEMGRPPKYDKEICKQVISLGKQGYSLTQIALELDIARSTLYEWRDKYPEFSDAIKKGREFAQVSGKMHYVQRLLALTQTTQRQTRH